MSATSLTLPNFYIPTASSTVIGIFGSKQDARTVTTITESRVNKIERYFEILRNDQVNVANPVSISKFLLDHDSLIEFSLYITKELKNVFSENHLSLELLRDREEGDDVLFLYISTDLEPVEAEKKLDEFSMQKLVPESHFIPHFGLAMRYV